MLNSESTRKMRYGTWFKIENGARNVCFMTETCEEWYVYGVKIVNTMSNRIRHKIEKYNKQYINIIKYNRI